MGDGMSGASAELIAAAERFERVGPALTLRALFGTPGLLKHGAILPILQARFPIFSANARSCPTPKMRRAKKLFPNHRTPHATLQR